MIDLPTVKAHLRVDSVDEDTLIESYLAAAQAAVESATGKLFAPDTVTQQLPGFPGCDKPIRLWKGPVAAPVTVTYDGPAGLAQPLADFRLIEGSSGKLLPAYGASWPCAYAAEGSVQVSYMAGYASGEAPPELDQAVLLLAGHYYANREAALMADRAAMAELPRGVEALIAPYRLPGMV
jgi:uncharacterized phiE125 gp8 family phage protein